MGMTANLGCLAGLFGASGQYTQYSIMTFRRLRWRESLWSVTPLLCIHPTTAKPLIRYSDIALYDGQLKALPYADIY